MPDRRSARRPHPKDLACFAEEGVPALRRAVADLSWLHTRGYPPKAALELADQTDRRLTESPAVVATADSAVLDRCDAWVNLARHVVEKRIPDAWIVDLGGNRTEAGAL